MKSLLNGKTKWRYNPAWTLEDEEHEQIWNDSSVHMKTKGLYGYMKTKPWNWDFSCARIAEDMADSVPTVKKAMRELEQHGYLRRTKLASGRVAHALATHPYVGIETEVQKSPLANYEVVLDELPARVKAHTKRDVVEHLVLAYGIYNLTTEAAVEIAKDNDLLTLDHANTWMANNFPKL